VYSIPPSWKAAIEHKVLITPTIKNPVTATESTVVIDHKLHTIPFKTITMYIMYIPDKYNYLSRCFTDIIDPTESIKAQVRIVECYDIISANL
jgi:hypothetical protein